VYIVQYSKVVPVTQVVNRNSPVLNPGQSTWDFFFFFFFTQWVWGWVFLRFFCFPVLFRSPIHHNHFHRQSYCEERNFHYLFFDASRETSHCYKADSFILTRHRKFQCCQLDRVWTSCTVRHIQIKNNYGMRVCDVQEIITYLLTPWCRVLLEKLTGLQLVRKFPAFHGT